MLAKSDLLGYLIKYPCNTSRKSESYLCGNDLPVQPWNAYIESPRAADSSCSHAWISQSSVDSSVLKAVG